MQRQSDVPDINSAVALVVVLMKRWSVDHSRVIHSTGGLCSPHQIHSASKESEEMYTTTFVCDADSMYIICCRYWLFQLSLHDVQTSRTN